MRNTAIFVNKIELKKNDGEISHTTSQHATLYRHDRSIPRDVPRDKGLYPVNIFIPWDNFWFIPLQPYSLQFIFFLESIGGKKKMLSFCFQGWNLNMTVSSLNFGDFRHFFFYKCKAFVWSIWKFAISSRFETVLTSWRQKSQNQPCQAVNCSFFLADISDFREERERFHIVAKKIFLNSWVIHVFRALVLALSRSLLS